MSQDKRVLPRHHLITYSEVKRAEDDVTVGFLIDVSTMGIRVISKQGFQPTGPVRLRIRLPATIHGAEWVELEAELLRCDKSSTPDHWESAMKMTHLDPDNQAILETAIGLYRFQN